MLFQFRHRFYHAYFVITALYVILLQFFPENIRPMTTIILLFSDTAALGFFFIGAIILLEKDQNILDSLFVTPLKIYEYVFAKIISLAVIALLSALAIVLFTFGFSVNLLLFIPGFLLVSSFYTLVGIVFSIISNNVNDYFAKSILVGLIASVSLLPYFSVIDAPVLQLLPILSSLTLIDLLIVPHSTAELVYAFSNIVIWLLITTFFARHIFYKNIIIRAGSAR